MTAKASGQVILVPVDFSPDSESALLCSIELAEALKASILVLHVVHDPGDAPGYYVVKGQDKHVRRLEDVAAGMLEEFIEKARKRHPGHAVLDHAQTELVVGLPVTRILESAKKHQARMIVMGSQGRTGLSHVLLGSKAEHVVRLSPIPVTIVKSKYFKE